MALSSIIWIDRCEGNALTLWYPTFSFGKTWPWAPAYTAVTELKWDKTCPSDWVIWDAQVFCGIATLPGHETDSFISYTVSSHRVVCKQIGRQAPSSISVGELRLRCLKLRNSTQGALHPMPTFIGKPENKPSSWKRELHTDFVAVTPKDISQPHWSPTKSFPPLRGVRIWYWDWGDRPQTCWPLTLPAQMVTPSRSTPLKERSLWKRGG